VKNLSIYVVDNKKTLKKYPQVRIVEIWLLFSLMMYKNRFTKIRKEVKINFFYDNIKFPVTFREIHGKIF
jgi:hypothetical protein